MRNDMLRKGLVLGISLFFITTSIVSAFNINPLSFSTSAKSGNWLYVGGNGPGNFSKIQDAINASSNGDTVFVFNGRYFGHLNVNKSITLIGEDKNTTFIIGFFAWALSIISDWVNLSGFTIQYDYGRSLGEGVRIDSCNNNIMNNIIDMPYDRIRLFGESNTISGNTIKSTYLYVIGDGNTISGNTITNNDYGIYITGACDNIISNNSFFNCGLFLSNDIVWNNVVRNNTVNGKPLVYVDGESDAVLDGDVGQIILVNCTNITVQNQEISNTTVGIQIWGSTTCVILGNTIVGNYYGICLYGWNNSIYDNTIINNDYGIRLESSIDNSIYHNNFIYNGLSAYDQYDNIWYYEEIHEGNYWSDYTGNDYNSDGIGDTPYPISGGTNQDNYPFINPNGWLEQPPSCEPIAYWSFDEGVGSVAHDSSGNGNDGTINGASWTSGVVGGALEFDGVDNVYVGDRTSLDITGDITICTWFKTSTLHHGMMVGKFDNINPDNGYTLYIGDYHYQGTPLGKLTFAVEKDSWNRDNEHTFTTDTSFTDGEWHFCVAIYQPGEPSGPKIYIDAINQSGIIHGHPLASIGVASGYPFKIGQYSSVNALNYTGFLDEVQIYDCALIDSEILYLYNNPGSENQPPIANFTYNPLSPTDLDIIQFTDTSTDTDGTIASWSWTFGDGGNSTLQNPTHDYADDGTYTVTLTITDNDGASDSTSKDVIVSNVAPVANADGPYSCNLGDTIIFDGSGSYDLDGTIVSYQWDFGDGTTISGINPTHEYSVYGTYTVTLIVTDDDGETDQDSTTACVSYGPNVVLLYPNGGEILKDSAMIKWIAYDTEDGANLSIYFYYSSDDGDTWSLFTSNPQNNTGEYSWDTTRLPDGAYLLQISAKDSDKNFGFDTSRQFQIKNNEEPPENLAPNKPSTPEGLANGKINADYIYVSITHDPEGDNVYYLWDWGDGNNSGWIGPSTSGVTSQATHNWSIKGNYAIKVKAKDVYGVESPWSDPLHVTMPYSYNPILQFIELLFERFPNAFPLLRQIMDTNKFISYFLFIIWC